MPRSALVSLLVLHAVVLLAPFLAPYHYAEQHRDYPYAPPTGVHLRGLRAVVYQPNSRAAVPLRLFVNGRLFGVDAPGVFFPLGTDGYGRDILSRILYGGRISIFSGLLAALIAISAGLVLGVTSGYFSGWIDQLLMRAAELFMVLPWLYLLLGVRALLPLHLTTGQAFLLVIGIIGAIGWVRPARLIRGVVLSARQQPYVTASRGFGAGPLHIIRRHILPQTWPVVLTQASILIPQYILAEVTLSFLGLGIGEPVPSWGNMLSEARQYHALVGHPWLLAPGIAAIPVLLTYLYVSDRLQQID